MSGGFLSVATGERERAERRAGEKAERERETVMRRDCGIFLGGLSREMIEFWEALMKMQDKRHHSWLCRSTALLSIRHQPQRWLTKQRAPSIFLAVAIPTASTTRYLVPSFFAFLFHTHTHTHLHLFSFLQLQQPGFSPGLVGWLVGAITGYSMERCRGNVSRLTSPEPAKLAPPATR